MKIGDMPLPRMIGIPGLFQVGLDRSVRGGKDDGIPVLPIDVFNKVMGGGEQHPEPRVAPFKGRRKADE